MIYTVTFNPSLDYTLSLEKLELGRVNRAAGETLAAGGKGLNVSMVLQNLGYPSTALGFVSGFTGDEIERWMEARRCATRFIHLPAGLSRINVKVRAEEESEINGLGPPIGPEALEGLYAILDELEQACEDDLWDYGAGCWVADYRLLRFTARKVRSVRGAGGMAQLSVLGS